MIDAVLLFGFMNIIFEFVLLTMLPPRTRLRVLGNSIARNSLHVIFLVLNLCIHWGTLIGTMSAVFAFISSLITVAIATWLYGTVTDGRYYKVGFIKYDIKELL